MYVDNAVTSVNDLEELRRYKDFAVKVFADAQMDLRLWEYTNNTGEIADPTLGNELNNEITTVLGVKWDKNKDVLSVKVEPLENKIVTKRTVLSSTQRVFDPLGWVSPVFIVPKLLLQSVWSANLGWDEELSTEEIDIFSTWAEELQQLKNLEIPRRLVHARKTESTWTLHCFTDASLKAYACAIFLRCEDSTGVSVSLLMSKSRVSPPKRITIPRLELLGCVIGVRIMKLVVGALHLEDVKKFYWTDAKVPLFWIRREAPQLLGIFVGNRVKEIQNSSKKEDWRFVPGEKNPADLPSRGCSATKLLESKWWEGPNWLRGSSDTWPSEIPEPENDLDVVCERRKVMTVSNVNTVTETSGLFRWFFNYHKTLRMVAWMLRMKNKKKDNLGDLSLAEIDVAEKRLMLMVQREGETEEFSFKHARCTRDADGLVRVETRILRRDDANDFVRSILLPRNHHVVELLVTYYHERNQYARVQVIMTLVREKFWIPGCRRVIKKILKTCWTCKRYKVKPMTAASSALPEDRVKDSAVFEVIGVDLTGPLHTKEGEKIWIVVFACAVYRCIHLELLTSMSRECFLQAFRRFVARRGRPKVVYSDHGRNFEGCVNLLKALDWKKIERDTEAERIQWKFIPPISPWWGGFYERLIGIFKKLIRRTLGRAILSYKEVHTLLCDVESTVNRRPLTYVSEDADDLVPLCPAMFLQDLRSSSVADVDQIDAYGYKKRYAYRQRLKEELRHRFRSEYLALLIQKAREQPELKLKVGDAVLLGCDDKRRQLWPIARIIKLIPGVDGKIRIVKVVVRSNNELLELTRSIQRIYPLEATPERISRKQDQN